MERFRLQTVQTEFMSSSICFFLSRISAKVSMITPKSTFRKMMLMMMYIVMS